MKKFFRLGNAMAVLVITGGAESESGLSERNVTLDFTSVAFLALQENDPVDRLGTNQLTTCSDSSGGTAPLPTGGPGGAGAQHMAATYRQLRRCSASRKQRTCLNAFSLVWLCPFHLAGAGSHRSRDSMIAAGRKCG
eukprot:COSAG06_NODE_24424_length_663_cov_0.968085_1_plen_136_part_01